MFLQLALFALVSLLARSLWYRWKYDVHKIPSPPGLPLLGHSFEFIYGHPSRQLTHWLRGNFKRFGWPKMMRAEIMGTTWLFVTDMDFIKNVLLSKTASYPKVIKDGGLLLPVIGNDPTAECLMFSENVTPYVKMVRKVYYTGLLSRNLKAALPKMMGVIRGMIHKIEGMRKQGPVDMQELSVKMALDVVGMAALDVNLGGIDGSRNLHDALVVVGRISRQRTYSPLKTLYCTVFKNSKLALEENTAIDRLNAEWAKLTNEIVMKPDPLDGGEPIWYGLKHLKHPETNQPVPVKSLIAEVAAVVTGGTDTTGYQLGWILALLASHPKVVEKLVEEMNTHGLYGEDAREVEYEDLSELSYLAAIIKEGMRLAHALPGSLMREVPTDTTILGYRVPKGTIVMLPGNRAVNTEGDWGDCMEFRPERWLAEGEDMSNKYNLGFLMGPRDCVGQRLAKMEMRVAILELVRTYEFILEGSFNDLYESSKDGLMIEANKGIWIHMNPRHQALSI